MKIEEIVHLVRKKLYSVEQSQVDFDNRVKGYLKIAYPQVLKDVAKYNFFDNKAFHRVGIGEDGRVLLTSHPTLLLGFYRNKNLNNKVNVINKNGGLFLSLGKKEKNIYYWGVNKLLLGSNDKILLPDGFCDLLELKTILEGSYREGFLENITLCSTLYSKRLAMFFKEYSANERYK